jgi:hypothetical protein
MQQKRSGVLMGGLLIIVGLWLLLRALGLALPGWDQVWPVILMLGAASALYGGLTDDPRNAEGVWFGVTGLLSGALFLHITAGAGEWSDMAHLWPAFPAAAGLGWLASWLVRPQEVATLVMGIIGVAVGVLGYAFTAGRLDPAFGRQLLQWWPLILIAIGLGYIGQYLAQKRS